ncbi:IgaA/UmoB family intracellular growth attenuator [Providencia sneebia]|nr:IgaA/UmoB family intracellular growth attenuator [Providencia sneebia]
MLNFVIIMAILIISLSIMASILYFRRRQNAGIYQIASRAEPSYRKMIDSDFQSISQYLRNKLSPSQDKDKTPWLVKKNAVIATVCNSVTQFNLRQEQTNSWRHFIDKIEVELPSELEPYLQQQNVMEVIETNHLPLIISVNSVSLKDLGDEWSVEKLIDVPPSETAIHERGKSKIQQLRERKETLEEYRMNHSSGWFGTVLVCLSFLLGYFVLIAVPFLQPWGLIGALAIYGVGLLSLVGARIFPKQLQDVHCIFGKPKRWELYGEIEKKQSSSVSINGTDLYYPPHWEPYIQREWDKETNIDFYPSGQVLRYGRFLSLHKEERYYPVKRYKKNILIAVVGLLTLALLFFYRPVSLPLKLGCSWFVNSEKVVVANVHELETRKLKVGDNLVAKGVGMCYRPPKLSESNQAQFVPFDCSGIYWNQMNAVPDLESEIVERSIQLLNEVQRQLHPDNNSVGVNPRLQSDIMKSGMNVIFDFSEIILKTNALCYEKQACPKLKSALINLGNTNDWETLVTKAETGKLKGAHVLLRAGSAEVLEKLVEATTYSFIESEIEKEAVKLNSPPPGGVLFISDENKTLVDFTGNGSFNEMMPVQRWLELKRASNFLVHTPFDIEGIITNLSTDANGTLQITLHRSPSEQVLLLYIVSSCFVLFLVLNVLWNGALVIFRIASNKKRLRNITQYYDKCFEVDNPSDQK